MDGTLIALLVGINLFCVCACVFAFWFVGKRQKKYLRQILREQFKGGAVMDANIAQNIHDFVINEQIFDVIKQLRPLTHQPHNPPELTEILHKIESIEQSLRHISDDIFPAHIAVAFGRICKNKIRDLADLYDYSQKGVEVVIEGEFENLPHQMLLLGLYRLIASFVGNAMKHHAEAQVTQIGVGLTLANNLITLSMHDNGLGFDIQKAVEWSVEMQHRGLSDFQNLAIALSLGANENDYAFYSVSKDLNLQKHGTFFDMKIDLNNYLQHETHLT